MAWWLAYEELYGDMDKEYPIMTKGEEHSDSYYDYNRNDVNLDNPFTDPKDRERAEKVVGKYPRQVWPSSKDDCYPTVGSMEREACGTQVDDVYAHHFPGTDTKPEPNLKYKSQKYEEDSGIKDLKDYISSTYSGHYTSDQNNTQTLELIQSVGDAESFCRSNAIKYLARYDKKGQAKRDILKAMHYCLLLYYFSGHTNNETPTRGYETF